MTGLADLDRPRLVLRLGDGSLHERPLPGPGSHEIGPVVVDVAEAGAGWSWRIGVPGSAPVAVVSVALAWDAGAAGDGPRPFSNGYQSWTSSRVRRLGAEVDPSNVAPVPALVRETHHADPAVTPVGELRSELVTVVATDRPGHPLLLVGFLAGTHHDGTIRARLHEGVVTLAAEAYLGGAVLAPGEGRQLHQVVVEEGDQAPELLAGWAAAVGEGGGARTTSPYQVGWCSWYQWFSAITEDAVRENLVLASAWPFEVFQLDDGYQHAIGDWQRTDASFPSGIASVAEKIATAGRTPGLWLAPFLAAPGSDLATAHPDWVVRHVSGRPLVGMVNEHWGGHVHVLDTTRPEVLAHLEETASALVAAGYPYLKLDFTYAPSIGGRYADPSQTPAQRVRAGMEAVRRGAGERTFLLGCGLPLGAGVGVVDGMRIGADVAPHWELRPGQYAPGGYAEDEPATVNAFRNTLTRSWMHRRLWLNDPDCLMLRTAETGLTPAEAHTWALTVGASGGMALVSDDLALLDRGARRLLEEVVALGRSADEATARGSTPRCHEVLDAGTPSSLTGGGGVLEVDLTAVSAVVR